MAGQHTKRPWKWEDWKLRVWDSFKNENLDHKGMIGLLAFEQWALRSKKEKRCIDCGKPGIVKQLGSRFVAAVSYYWMCQECYDYWQNKK